MAIAVNAVRFADRVGDDPGSTGQRDADGVGGPVEVILRIAGENRNPDQQFEDYDLRGEEAGSNRRHDAGQDGDSGPEKTQGGSIGPEHPGGRQPTWDHAQQPGHVNDVDDTERNGANAEEKHKEVPATRDE